MTIEQQNILELFKNNNRDLAEVLAVASGNTHWFKEEILDKITSIREVINRYCETLVKDHHGWLCFTECTEPICLQVFFKGIQMEALYDKDGDLIRYEIWTDDVIIYDNTYNITFECDENHEHALQEELKKLGIKLTIH